MSPAAPQRTAVPPPPGKPMFDPFTAGVVLFGVLAVVSLFGGAALSGVFAGHGVAVPRGVMSTVLAWVKNPGDPASAWPSDPRPGSAVSVYVCATVIMLLFGSLWAWLVIEIGARRDRKRLGGGLASNDQMRGVLDELGGKRSALRTRNSLVDAALKEHGGKKLSRRAKEKVLDRAADKLETTELVIKVGYNTADRRLVVVHNKDALLVIGPTGGGKTWRVACGLVLTAPGTVLVTTTKGDLLSATYLARSRRGRVAVFDPEGISGWPPGGQIRWSIISGCEDEDTAKRRAAALVAARPMGAGTKNGGFFQRRAAVIVRCYLHAAAVDGKRLSDVRRWVATGRGAQEPRHILEQHNASWLADLVNVLDGGSDDASGDVMSTVDDIFDPLSSPKLLAACDADADESFDVSTFLDSECDSLYLISEGESESIAPFVAALANEVHHVAKRKAQRKPGRRWDPPVRMVLDEMCNVAPIPNISQKMTDSGGQGLNIWAFVHNIDQIRDRFGREQAGALVKAAVGRLILPGLQSVDDLEDISRLLGQTTQWRQSAGADGRPSYSEYEKPIMSPKEIREMEEGEGLLVYRNKPGIKLRMPAYWEEPAMGELVEPSLKLCETIIRDQKIPVSAKPDPADAR
ncbi:type IV secretory system conjugative DNA transfer family protein (plasmid) [Rhodococcus sp. ZPP]|uniref:type IV secretory system conjugative DNA transfer family protein n=1 Tax=Rhodococcus sp. ZPP TaxID=2749906 RepID=UPI001AD89012|nr:type IV secretory system conjugative DNA transfer family protein [Rhodococcus sp. ZPP]QTJ71397.1 type IV secretory system conjugative DNA transfer family protein [Rhodococcus sp. ZPP]